MDGATGAPDGGRDDADDLVRALAAGEIHVVFQPVVTLATGRPVQLEALARWRHPTRGLLLPEEFVPDAERSGAIVPLGRRMLELAIGEAAALDAALGQDAPVVTVNVSAEQVRLDDLDEVIPELLARAGCRPSRLALELTETRAVDDFDRIGSLVARLRPLGVRLHLDNFGTGYASLSHLCRIPVDAIRIDRSLVAGIRETERAAAVVATVVALARTFGATVVAEGVESLDHLAMLDAVGCDLAQGTWFSPPLAPEDVLPYLERALLRAG